MTQQQIERMAGPDRRGSDRPREVFPLPLPIPDLPWFNVTESIGERSVTEGPIPPNVLEAVQACYLRPDVQNAVNQLTPALIDLMSNDEKATRAFSKLVGLDGVDLRDERLAPLLLAALLIGCAAAGGAVGYWSRP